MFVAVAHHSCVLEAYFWVSGHRCNSHRATNISGSTVGAGIVPGVLPYTVMSIKIPCPVYNVPFYTGRQAIPVKFPVCKPYGNTLQV